MAEGTAKQAAEDPSMEDILASIRQILNDEPPAEAAPVPPAATPVAANPVAANPAAANPAAVNPAAANPDDVFVLEQSMLIEEPVKMAPKPPEGSATPAPAPSHPFAPEPLAHQPFAPPAFAPQPAAHLTQAAHPAAPADPESEALLAPAAAAAASASMGALVRVLGQQQTQVYRGGPTLEDMVRDEIRPMVKSWLDEHLAPMVERMVRAEIARVTNGK